MCWCCWVLNFSACSLCVECYHYGYFIVVGVTESQPISNRGAEPAARLGTAERSWRGEDWNGSVRRVFTVHTICMIYAANLNLIRRRNYGCRSWKLHFRSLRGLMNASQKTFRPAENNDCDRNECARNKIRAHYSYKWSQVDDHRELIKLKWISQPTYNKNKTTSTSNDWHFLFLSLYR